jgi:hypothetical protein
MIYPTKPDVNRHGIFYLIFFSSILFFRDHEIIIVIKTHTDIYAINICWICVVAFLIIKTKVDIIQG